MGKDLLAELVDKLIEAQIDFGLHFVVQELLSEDSECVVRRVVVQVQGIQDKSV